MPLFRDPDLGNVVVQKPSSNLEFTVNSNNNLNIFDSNKLIVNTSLNNIYNQSQRTLAGYVGPVSPTNVSLIINLI